MHYSSFEEFLTVSRGLQPVTILGYVGAVRRMKKVLGDEPTHDELNRYICGFFMSPCSYAHKTNTCA